MENLWNQSEYETILDMWGTWIKLTAWQNFVPYPMALKIGKGIIFLPFGIYHSQFFIILTHCGSTFLHWLFRLTLMRDLIQQTEKVRHKQSRRHGRQDQPSANKMAFPLYITITDLSWKLCWYAVIKLAELTGRLQFLSQKQRKRRTCKDGHYMCKALLQYKHLLNWLHCNFL